MVAILPGCSLAVQSQQTRDGHEGDRGCQVLGIDDEPVGRGERGKMPRRSPRSATARKRALNRGQADGRGDGRAAPTGGGLRRKRRGLLRERRCKSRFL